MREFFGILLYPVGVALFMLPIALVLFLATVVANLFSGVCKPITEPIRAVMEIISERVPNPLDRIPSFPQIKRYLGSTKNILFIAFIIFFLLFHYLTLANSDIALINISQLFPGSAFGTIISFAMSYGELDFSSFFVNPEDYLRTVIFSIITGLFLHIGCTTKDEDARIPFLVKLGYIVLITLFSSVVLGMIPSNVFTITLPEYSSQLESVSIVIDTSSAKMMLATLQQWGGILLKNLITLIPAIVAVYFLCQSISGFAASFLGGLAAMAALSMFCPQVFLYPDSFGTAVILLVAVSLAEAVALLFGELIDKIVARLLENIDIVFEYYNIVTLLISYFSYPLLALPVLSVISSPANGFHFTSRLINIACLIVFSLVTFAGYKINEWVWRGEAAIDGKKYAILMIINVPILIAYGAMFKI